MKATRRAHLPSTPLLAALMTCVFCALAGCSWFAPPPGIGGAVSWRDLPGWDRDHHAQTWPALQQSCTRLERREKTWGRICAAARDLPTPTDAEAREFYERWLEPYSVRGKTWRTRGLITGYYEPLLNGSFIRSDEHRYPIYAPPEDLVVVDLSDLFPELRHKTVRGLLTGRKVVPYYDRQQIEGQEQLLSGKELLWVDDPVALFFLHIQGSGRVRLDDGSVVGVGYADQNGHPYRSIGRMLIDMGELAREDVNMFTIRDWLMDHPERAENLLHRNPSYIFFQIRETLGDGPVGSLNVPLTPERSLAVDRAVIPLGIPVWLDTTLPGDSATPYRRLVFAQDTGGAISGPVRADLFWGHGSVAERMAGAMKQPGRLFVLLPRKRGK